jgi:hypothetical protein
MIGELKFAVVYFLRENIQAVIAKNDRSIAEKLVIE